MGHNHYDMRLKKCLTFGVRFITGCASNFYIYLFFFSKVFSSYLLLNKFVIFFILNFHFLTIFVSILQKYILTICKKLPEFRT